MPDMREGMPTLLRQALANVGAARDSEATLQSSNALGAKAEAQIPPRYLSSRSKVAFCSDRERQKSCLSEHGVYGS